MIARIRLSESQRSALECRQDALDPETLEAWSGDHLVVEEARAEALMSELIEASNAEDAEAEERRRQGDATLARYAGRASRSFSAMAGKVCKVIKASRKIEKSP